MNDGIVILAIVFIIIIFSLAKSKGTSKSKYNKLHNWTVVFLVLGLIITGIIGVMALSNKLNKAASTSSVSSADGFTIQEYKVVMNVDESCSVDVKEYITVNFYEIGHHGIYRFIPSWLEYTNKEGVTQSRESNLSNLKAVGDKYTVDTIKGKKRIKIGDANRTLPLGNHTYEIDYKYDMGADPYKNFDEFIFHAFGDYWGTEIKNATIIINLPKSFDAQNKIKFFADKYRKNDISSYVNYTVERNTIYAKLSSNYKLKNSLTVDVELPEGYFVGGNDNYGMISLVLCALCIIFAIISIILWYKNGRDIYKVPETVEFYPPENLDASVIGYLYKTDTGRKLSIALIIELASKGFLKIMESEDKKIQIVKTSITDVSRHIKREIKIIKLKDYVGISSSRQKIMDKYLGDKNENIITSDFDNFYDESKYFVDKGYIKIESDSINNYSEKELETIKQELLANEFKDRPEMSENEKIVYDELFSKSDETILSENLTFYKVFSKVAESVRNSFEDKINDLTAYKYMLICSFGFLVCTICWGLAYSIFEDLNPKLNSIYTIAFISNIVTFIFTILMKRKNSYGEQLKAKISGFRNYIELAEKEQLEMLVEKNPNYFYDILPYAYVLDVSRKWVEKFENIPIPTEDMGNFNYYDTSSLDSLSSSVYYPSSSSSSSGCGGGCSSCGGGCSSCGGGGSW